MSESVSGSKMKAKVFETILSSPGMTEKCKIVLNISRQNVLLLGRLMEFGILDEKNEFGDEIITVLPKESLQEFKEIFGELLEKANLTEFYAKLKLI